nr:glycosyltransferase family 39 protein [Conexibacter arvalis]
MLDALPHRESNPPLFYVLEWLTTRALGESEAALRALSAVAGTLLVAVAWAIGRRVGGTRVALATAALIAVNPLLVWFSQEARNYELVALLSAVSLLLFLRGLDDDRPRLLVWWAIVSALTLATHYFSCFVLAPQIAWLLWRHPRRGAVVGATAALALVTAALLPMLLEQRGNPYDIAQDAIAVRLVQIPKQFLLGYRGPLALPLGLLGTALAAGGAWLLLRRAAPQVRWRAMLVGGIGLCGIALPLLAAVAGADYLNTRNLLPALVPLATALAAGFAAERRTGPALLGLLCGISVAIVTAVAVSPGYQRADWEGLARGLGVSREPRAIVIAPANGGLVLRYYRPELTTLPLAGRPVREVDVVGVAGAAGPGAEQRLPDQVGTQFEAPGFTGPDETRTERWVLQRYRSASPILVQPPRVASIRFSQEPPNVSYLPPGR